MTIISNSLQVSYTNDLRFVCRFYCYEGKILLYTTLQYFKPATHRHTCIHTDLYGGHSRRCCKILRGRVHVSWINKYEHISHARSCQISTILGKTISAVWMDYCQQISVQPTVIWNINKVHDNYIYTWYDILTQSPMIFVQEGLQTASIWIGLLCALKLIWFDYWLQFKRSPLVHQKVQVQVESQYISGSMHFLEKKKNQHISSRDHVVCSVLDHWKWDLKI